MNDLQAKFDELQRKYVDLCRVSADNEARAVMVETLYAVIKERDELKRDFEHHSDWGVLSEDRHVYGVTPNTREKAERECRLLRQDGEPRAMVIETRSCAWAKGTLKILYEPRDDDSIQTGQG